MIKVFNAKWLCLFIFIPFYALANDSVDELLNMSFEDFNNIKVTSVSKKPEDPFEAAAAIYVLTADDIRRMGATSIPEALRVVPGIEVNRMDANKWAITSRGFNSQFSNKLLVLMDGRSVYTPLFSGVYWDVQDTVLEDIARIEIIRGPGAALWGANAFNGVINIITKDARSTQGSYVSALAGNEDRFIGSARYGGKVNDSLYYRFYAKHADRDASETLNGLDANDDWYVSRGGFKVDWDKTHQDKLTFQGDVYSGLERQFYYLPGTSGTTEGDEAFRGGNLTGKWEHRFENGSDATLQLYIDHIERNISILDQERTTIDVDFQHVWDVNARNQVIWGLGYRHFWDDLDEKTISGTTYLSYVPEDSHNNLYSGFIQDKITLVEDRFYLTLGSKFEHHYFTGFEVQPNARVTWTPDEKQTIWGAVSRAVRTPTRGENGITLVGIPGVLNQQGSPDYASENLIAYEIGYRVQPHWRVMLDATAFYNDYDELRIFESDGGINLVADNGGHGEAYGFELASRFSMTRNWNLYANYSFFTLDTHLDPNRSEVAFQLEVDEGRSATNRFNLMSRVNLPYNLELDNNLMYVDNLSSINIPNYIRFDTRIGWKPKKGLEVSLVGQNLFDSYHQEFTPSLYSVASEVQRSFYGKVTIEF